MRPYRPRPPPGLLVTMSHTVILKLRGEIDIVTAGPLSARIDALTSGPGPDLVLDLRPVTFIDCRGLALLCRARTRVRNRGGRLRLVVENPHVLRLLRLTGLGGAFELCRRPPAADRSPAIRTAGTPC
jgi:anti-sigma B factor antagonist